jgi:ribonuclease BN (tRNA processing enzyme)
MNDASITRRQFTGRAALAALAAGSLGAAAADPRPAGMKITILGDSTCIPDVGHDAASFLINGKHLVDTGWYAALKMREYGFDPLALESIIITHCHQDHTIGLPQLLFFAGLKKRPGPPLAIIGPGEYLKQVVDAAVAFLQTPRFPEIAANYRLVPLKAGDRFELSDLRVETMAANHTSGHNRREPALVYKATDKTNGACAVFTGDTHYHPPIAEFARGVPLLIHDGAHTAAKDAASVAREAGVGRLVLIHHTQKSAAKILAAAQAVFPNTDLAKEGLTLEVPASR